MSDHIYFFFETSMVFGQSIQPQTIVTNFHFVVRIVLDFELSFESNLKYILSKCCMFGLSISLFIVTYSYL